MRNKQASILLLLLFATLIIIAAVPLIAVSSRSKAESTVNLDRNAKITWAIEGSAAKKLKSEENAVVSYPVPATHPDGYPVSAPYAPYDLSSVVEPGYTYGGELLTKSVKPEVMAGRTWRGEHARVIASGTADMLDSRDYSSFAVRRSKPALYAKNGKLRYIDSTGRLYVADNDTAPLRINEAAQPEPYWQVSAVGADLKTLENKNLKKLHLATAYNKPLTAPYDNTYILSESETAPFEYRVSPASNSTAFVGGDDVKTRTGSTDPLVKDAIKLVGSKDHFMLLTKTGDVYGWGSNSNKKIFDSADPAPIAHNNIKRMPFGGAYGSGGGGTSAKGVAVNGISAPQCYAVDISGCAQGATGAVQGYFEQKFGASPHLDSSAGIYNDTDFEKPAQAYQSLLATSRYGRREPAKIFADGTTLVNRYEYINSCKPELSCDLCKAVKNHHDKSLYRYTRTNGTTDGGHFLLAHDEVRNSNYATNKDNEDEFYNNKAGYYDTKFRSVNTSRYCVCWRCVQQQESNGGDGSFGERTYYSWHFWSCHCPHCTGDSYNDLRNEYYFASELRNRKIINIGWYSYSGVCDGIHIALTRKIFPGPYIDTEVENFRNIWNNISKYGGIYPKTRVTFSEDKVIDKFELLVDSYKIYWAKGKIQSDFAGDYGKPLKCKIRVVLSKVGDHSNKRYIIESGLISPSDVKSVYSPLPFMSLINFGSDMKVLYHNMNEKPDKVIPADEYEVFFTYTFPEAAATTNLRNEFLMYPYDLIWAKFENDDTKWSQIPNDDRKTAVFAINDVLIGMPPLEEGSVIVEDIDAGENFSLALVYDINSKKRYLTARGDNSLCQLGVAGGATVTTGKIFEGDLANKIKRLAAGKNHSLMLTKDGELYTWGGSPAALPRKIAPLPAGEIVSIAAGDDWSYMAMADGRVYRWHYSDPAITAAHLVPKDY